MIMSIGLENLENLIIQELHILKNYFYLLIWGGWDREKG